jgi:hypothetical protein
MRRIVALAFLLALTGCAIPGAAVAKCDHACWKAICKDMARRDGPGYYAACMRDADRP